MVDRRAVSDTLGFIFVFSLVLSTVGVVTAVGMDGLQDTRNVERINNAERAFDILDDNMEDIAIRGAPSRATEIKLAESALSFGDPVRMEVEWEDGGVVDNATVSTRPLVYTSETSNERLVYAFGTVFRGTDESMTVVRHPAFLLSEDAVVVSAISTRRSAQSANSVGGSGTYLVRAEMSDSGAKYRGIASESGSYDVTVNVTSPRPQLWKTELQSYDDVTCPFVNDTMVSCELTGVDSIRVVEKQVDVSLVD
ncbi:hypothetical protein GJR96_14680 [Haloferax sp. MBLA0076]|uniref:Uncharacterized protein n=1 Tax=Haloferax litoreum TaxID=2666140 RepID=A0A6A8GLY6_9EURY|nr:MULTISPECIES: hypothetical protein [Haloferax]KAB1194620.1 hypothetical protein Hfx1148_14610 [Haloferax sp. CBA1148]MRX23197.1 hypothetical protein [Haloferax litoreum]